MANKKSNPLTTELRRFLRKYPKTGSMELLLPDVNGILKGKRIRKSDFDGICKNGFFFCGGTIMLTTLGGTVPGLRYTEIDGDPDSPARLVTGSIAPVPWAKRAMGQALFRLYNDDGSNFFADPRTALESALAPFDKMGVRIVMATELEFYLLDANADRPTPSTARVPGTNRPQPGPQVYHPDDLWEVEPFMDDVYSICEAQSIPADTAISEYAPGQFEINLHHVGNPVLACDHALLLKRAVKAAAKKHGFVACFMAKPFTDDAGNGLHIHMSLYDRNGKNYFSHARDKMAKPPFSTRLRHAVGGLLKTLPEATAIFAPNINSFRRLRVDMFAPVETNWGVNHRVVAVRIPSADSKNLRFEHRVAGADANPYLVTAAILAGVHHGLKNKIEPPRMVEQGQEIRPKLSIPNRWDNALDKFARSKVLPGYLGEDFCEYFLANRRHECELFHNEVSSLDHDWYLRSL